MKKCYFLFLFITGFLLADNVLGQTCTDLSADFITFESRCAATGAIKINVTGGSGNFRYQVTGPINYGYTSADSITGLSPGLYNIEIQDINNNCSITQSDIQVLGDYADPRFGLESVSVTCDNGSNGIIKATNIERGREPFVFTIMDPSPYGVGTSNETGIFDNLIGGEYTVRMTDSCGGIQTRIVSLANYTWWIDGYDFTKTDCNSAEGWIKVRDSRGNINTSGEIENLEYGILVLPGTDIIWSDSYNFNFAVDLTTESVEAFVRDACGNIKMVSDNLFLLPKVGTQVQISNKDCDGFDASLTGISNFFDPQFVLLDENEQPLEQNTTGIFENIPYGKYYIDATDACADTTIRREIIVDFPVPSIADEVNLYDKDCTSFSAEIIGRNNLVNPQFYLFNGDKTQELDHNPDGIFTGLAYGEYCIETRTDCPTTTITRCFSVGQPVPQVPESLVPSFVDCDVFNLAVTGDSLYNPTFCLFDDENNELECNNTGIFNGYPLGDYTVTIHDECTDITIVRSVSASEPSPVNDLKVKIENQDCETFTAHVTSKMFNGATFYLYQNEDKIAESNDGYFNGLDFGEYCITTLPVCPDQPEPKICFQAEPLVPTISNKLRASNLSCSTFTASVSSVKNFFNPEFFLTNEDGDTLATNSSGKFNDVPYGSYCILARDNCTETTIAVCGTVDPPEFSIKNVKAYTTCEYGFTKVTVELSSYPGVVSIYRPDGTFVYADQLLTASKTFDNLPELPDGEQYKIVAENQCLANDVAFVTPVVSWFTNSSHVVQKCPGAAEEDGLGDIHAIAETNTGNLTVRVIKKNGVTLSVPLTPDIVQGNDYAFYNLGPGTYTVRYQTSDVCRKTYFDEITVKPYEYPNLDRSSAFQCDADGFSVGAVASNGIGPFSYEIIGSSPEEPSIKAGPQAEPVFHIDNGGIYSLIRLRALDVCGNATLGDVSVLPLANNGIHVVGNCISEETILSLDYMDNATVNWYFRKNQGDPDNELIYEGFELSINPTLNENIGFYTAVLNMSNGCINRTYEFHLDGECEGIVAIENIDFAGRYNNDKSYLDWKIETERGLASIVVEREIKGEFEPLATIDAGNYASAGRYEYVDQNPQTDNFYRLKLVYANGKTSYSKIIFLEAPGGNGIRVYPNPATSVVNVEFKSPINSSWKIELINAASQIVFVKEKITDNRYVINRTPGMASGLYFLRVTDLHTGRAYYQKVILGSK